MTSLHARCGPAHDLRELTRAEHLVLFGFRAMALGQGDCPALARAFHGMLGAEAEAALCDLLAFVRILGAAGARRVRLHAPGCCAVSEDERLILAAVAAAQAALAQGDETGLRACLADLLDRGPCEASLMATQSFAAALMISGLNLPAPPRAFAPRRTLH